jgi:ABC-2 type transport system permease protein
MKYAIFASRNIKELLRDPFSLLFGIGLPLFLLFIMTALQKSIAVDVFEIKNFAPGMAIFSFSFISLFSGMLISKDRSNSFLTRLFASPLSASDYILGYSLPLIPIAIMQSSICFVVAVFLGLNFNLNIFVAILALIPVSLLFIGIGLLLGTIFNDKQVGGITSILIQIIAFSSGMWFDLNLVGGAYKTISYSLPFSHAVDLTRAIILNDYSSLIENFLWVIGYTIIIFGFSIIIFRKKMKE